jgi:cation diffusion facilitator family transporter
MSKNKDDNGTGHIIQSLLVNLVIASLKGFAAFMTASGAMLAETIHSFSDCANQALLLLGVKQSRRPATKTHPLGYGRAVYFWSFMVAMLLFTVGGMFSIYEGLHKLHNPEAVEHVEWGVGILIVSLLLEGYAAFSNVVELNKRRGVTGFFTYLKSTKDSDLIVIFGENSAAVLGLIIALIALLTAYFTKDGRYDAMGSLAIGVVLIAVAIFLTIKVKSLLIGESADVVINNLVQTEADKHPEILDLINCITIQQGPGEVLMCIKIKCRNDITALALSKVINDFEREIRTKAPEVKWIYIEPDLQEWKNK